MHISYVEIKFIERYAIDALNKIKLIESDLNRIHGLWNIYIQKNSLNNYPFSDIKDQYTRYNKDIEGLRVSLKSMQQKISMLEKQVEENTNNKNPFFNKVMTKVSDAVDRTEELKQYISNIVPSGSAHE